MSGMLAILQLDGAPIDETWLRAATAYLSDRGPDEQWIWSDGQAGLGHALLRTTFEAQNEHQPLTLDGQVWLTADARLDGRSELIAQLRSRGREVASDPPDADLLLHAYHAWGEACLEHLIGDFAFAIWDSRVQRLFCGRDQFGATPFYYARAGGALLLSNTLNALRLHPAVPDTLDEETLGEYLLFNLYPASEATTFAAIRRLRPAHALTVREGRVEIRRYWAPPETVETLRYRRPEEYVEHFRDLFEQAVGDRLRTDAVASHLSGGLDSGSIAATAQRLLRNAGRPFDLRGYTMVFERLIPDDEGLFAQQIADRSGFPTERFPIDDFYLREPPTPPPFLTPEPWGLPGQIAHQEIVERAAPFSRVLLEGYGGDPLLAGRRQSVGERWQAGNYLAALRGLAAPLYRRFFPRPAPPKLTMPVWFDPAFAARTSLAERWQAWLCSASGVDQQRGMTSEALWETVFIGADPAFTGAPLKTRWPFFDLRLLNFLLGVPVEPWRRAKYLLRQAMRDTLPETVRLRPKTPLRGFPQAAALRQQGLPAWMRPLAAAPEIAPYVDRAVLARVLEVPAAQIQVAPALSLAFWLRHQHRPDAKPWIKGGTRAASRLFHQ